MKKYLGLFLFGLVQNCLSQVDEGNLTLAKTYACRICFWSNLPDSITDCLKASFPELDCLKKIVEKIRMMFAQKAVEALPDEKRFSYLKAEFKSIILCSGSANPFVLNKAITGLLDKLEKSKNPDDEDILSLICEAMIACYENRNSISETNYATPPQSPRTVTCPCTPEGQMASADDERVCPPRPGDLPGHFTGGY